MNPKPLPVKMIMAIDLTGLIGRDGGLPWHLPNDLKRFKRLTTGDVILMGRETYESIGRALPGRHNIVLTSRPEMYARDERHVTFERGEIGAVIDKIKAGIQRDEYTIAQDKHGALQRLHPKTVWVIGGASVYSQAMSYIDEIELTIVIGSATTMPVDENGIDVPLSNEYWQNRINVPHSEDYWLKLGFVESTDVYFDIDAIKAEGFYPYKHEQGINCMYLTYSRPDGGAK